MNNNLNYLTVTEAEEVARLAKVIQQADKKVMKFALHTSEVPNKDTFLSDYVEIKILSNICGQHKAALNESRRRGSSQADGIQEALDMAVHTLAVTIRGMRENLTSSGYPKENFDTLIQLMGEVSVALEEHSYFRSVQTQKENNESE